MSKKTKTLRDLSQVEMAMIVAQYTWAGTSLVEGALEVLKQVSRTKQIND